MIAILKRYLLVLFLFVMVLCTNSVNSAELYRVKPIKFDLSNSIIFIPVKSNPANNISNDLSIKKLEKENGVVITIPSGYVEKQHKNLDFSEGKIKNFSIEQQGQSAEIKMVFVDNFNVDNLKIGNINNNILITVTSLQPYQMNYYVNTYRENENPKDYKETLQITTKDIEKTHPAVNYSSDNHSMNEINQAFSNSNYNNDEVYTKVEIEDITKASNLRSKYYLFDAKVKDSVFKITGVGTINVQKPFLLENPLRMVMDLPNSTLNPDLHNKEQTLENGDILKTAQFTPNTVRLVITSEQAKQYLPVYSPDSQGLIIANPKNILTTHLPSHKTNIVKFNFQKVNKTENFLFEFDKPLAYAIKRTSEYLYIYFLNAEKYNDTNFHSAIKNTPFSEMSVHLLSTGMRIKLPVQYKEELNTYISPDGKVFKISMETHKPVLQEEIKTPEKIKELTKKEGGIKSSPKYTEAKNHKIVVIDAGHGGKDCGALRGNITEKAINLDVCNKLKSILEKKGYKVYMTRTDDTYISLEDRTIFTEGINPAAFVSVHVNSCNAESPRGIETHYYHDNSLDLADAVHKNLIRKIPNTTNRGLLKSRFYVINHTTVPAILVEIGFISNNAERYELTTQQRQQATAEGIAEGIIEFLKGLEHGNGK